MCFFTFRPLLRIKRRIPIFRKMLLWKVESTTVWWFRHIYGQNWSKGAPKKLSFLRSFLGSVPGSAFCCFLVSFWPPLGSPWGSLGTPWAPLGDLGSPLGAFGPPLEAPWGSHGTPLAPLGCFCLVLLGFCLFFIALACSLLLLAAPGLLLAASGYLSLLLAAPG